MQATDVKPENDYSNLKPKEEYFVLPDKKRYVLVEASEDAFRQFRTAQSAGASLNQESKAVSVGSGIGDSDSVLVKGCLYEVKDDGSRGTVALGFVRALPRAITQKMAKIILGWLIEAEDADAPKEPQTRTPATST